MKRSPGTGKAAPAQGAAKKRCGAPRAGAHRSRQPAAGTAPDKLRELRQSHR